MKKLTEKQGGEIWKIETYNGKIVYKIKNLKNMVAKLDKSEKFNGKMGGKIWKIKNIMEK